MVVAIITLFLTVVLIKRSTFENGINLENVAYEAILSIRSAQMMGSNGRIPAGESRSVPYGVRVVPNSSDIKVFVDENQDLKYDTAPSPSDKFIEQYSIPKNKGTFSRFCVTDQFGGVETGAGLKCSNTSGNNYTALDMVFTRPDVTPYFSVYKGSNGSTLVGSNYKEAVIYMKSTEGIEQGIIIVSQGLIYVQ